MSVIRGTILTAVLGLTTAPLMLVQAALLRLSSPMARTLPWHYHRFLCRLLDIRIHVEGDIPATGPVLIAANHTSWLDIPVLSAIMPLSFIAKSNVAGWPVFGTLARLQRTVFIDRRRRSRTLEQKNEIANRLGQSDILVLFAEGTSNDGNRVLPFLSALFAAADEAAARDPRVQVLPLSLAYTRLWGMPMDRLTRPEYAWYGDMDLLPHIWTVLKRGPIDVTIRLHRPVSPAVAGGRKRLAALCEAKVRRGVADALTGRPLHQFQTTGNS